jgi:hypothetical protein
MSNDPSQPGEPHAPSGTTAATAGLRGTAVVQRGLNDTRLAILGIMLSIALEVAFGVQNVAWWWRVALGLLVFAGIASSAHLVLSRERPTHIVMELAHWVLGRKH